MGACLSCLGGGDDSDVDERTSLLNNNVYSDEHLQEEMWKQQQRQDELNTIVSDLNEHLIDVSTFLSGNTQPSHPGSQFLIASPRVNDGDFADATASPSVGPAGLEVPDKPYPRLVGVEEKEEIMKSVELLGVDERSCSIAPASGPLYVTF